MFLIDAIFGRIGDLLSVLNGFIFLPAPSNGDAWLPLKFAAMELSILKLRDVLIEGN